jgi:hypothetical protein
MTAEILRAGIEDGVLLIVGRGFNFTLQDIIKAEKYSRKIGCTGFYIEKIMSWGTMTFSNHGRYMVTLNPRGQFLITVDKRNDPRKAVDAIEEDVQNRLVDS